MSITELLETYKQKYYSKISYNLSLTHNVLEAHVFFDDFEILNILEIDNQHGYYVNYYKPKQFDINLYNLISNKNYPYFMEISFCNLYYTYNTKEYDEMIQDIKDHIEKSTKLDLNYKDFIKELDKIRDEMMPILKIKPTEIVNNICKKKIDILKDTYGDFLK